MLVCVGVIFPLECSKCRCVFFSGVFELWSVSFNGMFKNVGAIFSVEC